MKFIRDIYENIINSFTFHLVMWLIDIGAIIVGINIFAAIIARVTGFLLSFLGLAWW